MKWEFGVSRGTVSYMGWINSKVLLYSIGNYIQYPVINHNGKYCICINITELLCYTEKLRQHCKSKNTSIKFKNLNSNNSLSSVVSGQWLSFTEIYVRDPGWCSSRT